MNERILIVDDDEDALNMIAMLLKRRGYDPIKVTSGRAALDYLARNLPDLIVLDVMMPGLDGNEVCKEIRADTRTSNIPIVMLTARSETASQIEGLMAGADDYVVKPAGMDELVSSVQAALARVASAPIVKTARVISVLGVQAGVGATTLAVNVASAMAPQGRTVLIDLEPGGAAARHLGLKPAHSLSDLLAYPADTLDMDGIENALTLHPGGLNVLAASSAPMDVTRASAILSALREIYNACVLDLGTGLTPLAQAMIARSTVLLLALNTERVTLAQATQVLDGILAGGSPLPEIKLVHINRLGTPDDVALAAIQSALGRTATIIGLASSAMYQSLERGEPLVTSQPDHPVSAQIRALTAWLSLTQ